VQLLLYTQRLAGSLGSSNYPGMQGSATAGCCISGVAFAMPGLASDVAMDEADQAGPSTSGPPSAMPIVKSDPDAPPRSSSLAAQLRAAGPKDVLFVPIYGQDDSTDALCSLLRIEGVTILLDCGWTEQCDPAMLAPLAEVAPLVDLVRHPLSSELAAGCLTLRARACAQRLRWRSRLTRAHTHSAQVGQQHIAQPELITQESAHPRPARANIEHVPLRCRCC
jgi:hypothetical protein